MPTRNEQAFPQAGRLGLWDAVSMIVGIVIGAGIFGTPSAVFSLVSSPRVALAAWGLGGALSFAGALCIAELASAYPRAGGEYVFLTRAYGRAVGFFFGWGQLVAIRTGGAIAAVSYIFAEYAARLLGTGAASVTLYAALAIVCLTGVNILGTVPGKWVQNLLSGAKVAGLGGIALAGLLCAPPRPAPPAPAAAAGSFALAMVFVLYTYGGWNDAAYIASELRDRRRNIPLALLLGTGIIMATYLLVNAAFLRGLGFASARSSGAIAADLLAGVLGEPGGRLMSALVMVSTLGAVNGTIFTGSRLYFEIGSSYRMFRLLGQWTPGRGAAVWSLLLQGGIAIGMVVAAGAWWGGARGFESLVKCTAPVFWLFLLLTSLSLFVLRAREKGTERPFRVPLYPLVPAVFCGWCGYMLYGSVAYAGKEAAVGGAVLLAGAPFYLAASRLRPQE